MAPVLIGFFLAKVQGRGGGLSLDQELLSQCSEILEDFLLLEKRELSPGEKAKTVCELYSLVAETEGGKNTYKPLQALRLIREALTAR